MSALKRLAIVTTHPIQYNAPWFRLLSQRSRIQIRVFYTWSQLAGEGKFDPGFAKTIDWDIPLLEGYEYQFVRNTSKKPGSSRRSGIVNPELSTIISDWNPDALLVFGWNFDSHWKCIRYFHGRIPVIFRGDSTFLRKQNFIGTQLRVIYLQWIYRHIDYALYVGKENWNYFRRCGLPERKLVYAPHAVDNDRFSTSDGFDAGVIRAFREKIGIKNDWLTLLFAAKWETVKNPRLYIDFASQFSNQPINFILAGNGPLDAQVRHWASAHSHIHLLGFQNQTEMPLLYRAADYYCMSSDSETWGLAINEAMACSRGVIVRNTCGCATDLVREGLNGFIFDSSDMESLYHKILLIIDHPKVWKKMGQESLKLIQAFSFERIVDAVEQLVDKKN